MGIYFISSQPSTRQVQQELLRHVCISELVRRPELLHHNCRYTVTLEGEIAAEFGVGFGETVLEITLELSDIIFSRA